MHICTLTKLLRLCTPLPPPLPRYPTARAFQRALAPRAPGLDQLAAAAADTGECSKIWDEAETETDEGPVPEEEEEEEDKEEGIFPIPIPGPPQAPATEQEAGQHSWLTGLTQGVLPIWAPLTVENILRAHEGGYHCELLRICTPLPPTPHTHPNAGRTLLPPSGKEGEVCSGSECGEC